MCVLPPYLFSLYNEKILTGIKNMNGIKINDININNIRYPDCQKMPLYKLEDVLISFKLNSRKLQFMLLNCTVEKTIARC